MSPSPSAIRGQADPAPAQIFVVEDQACQIVYFLCGQCMAEIVDINPSLVCRLARYRTYCSSCG